MDGWPCTDLHDYSHVDPDCGLVHLIYICVRSGAIRKLMETTPRQFGNTRFLQFGCGANHISDDAKDEQKNLAPHSSAVVCAVRTGHGAHIDRWQRRW